MLKDAKPNQFADLNAHIEVFVNTITVSLEVQSPSDTADLPLERQQHLIGAAAHSMAAKLELLAFTHYMGAKLRVAVGRVNDFPGLEIRGYARDGVTWDQLSELVQQVIYDHAIALKDIEHL